MFPSILSNPWFHVIGIPIIFVFIGVFANRLGRRSNDESPMKNDWAIATTVLLMALGAIAADLRQTTTGAVALNSVGWAFLILFFVFVSIDHDRYRSWESDNNGEQSNSKRTLTGIILPDLLSLTIFVVYQLSKVNIGSTHEKT
jgi:MFS family permease